VPINDLVIRPARADELEAVLDLYKHLHAVDVPLPSAACLAETWRQITNNLTGMCVVAYRDGVLVGSCTLAVIPNMTRGARPYGMIENVVTRSEYRRKGIGTSVLQYALKVAWSRNCYKVMLLTGSKKEETLRFYEKAGFRRGIKTGFIAVHA
jgi:GNAT superfamily N-acetyltransferase